VDAGVREGDRISPHYDSMIAKLIVWGEDRAQALARLDAALRDTHIVGPATNVAFLRRVVNSPSFATADLDTGLIERERPRLFDQPGLPMRWAVAAAFAEILSQAAGEVNADPWSQRDGWRIHGRAARRIDLAVGSVLHQATLAAQPSGSFTLGLNESHWPFTARDLGGNRHEVTLGGERQVVTVHRVADLIAVFGTQGTLTLRRVDALAEAARAAQGQAAVGGLKSPMPGKVLAYLVRAGDAVQAGQPLAVMEAMKMEHTLAAPRDGSVAELLFAVGDQIAEGAELLRLAPLP
jgi:3-methylcrotonyl-CoA carboxylase alpha subunit